LLTLLTSLVNKFELCSIIYLALVYDTQRRCLTSIWCKKLWTFLYWILA